jgi:hypothetical protein
MCVDLFARLLLWTPRAPPNLEYFREFMMRPTFLGSREGKILLLLYGKAKTPQIHIQNLYIAI